MERDRWLALAAAGVGGVSLLGAVGYGLEAAWRQGLVGPAHAVVTALVLGMVGLLGGELLWSGRWRAAAAGLSGASLGALYLALLVAHAAYAWIGWVPAVALLLAVTVVGGVQAVRRDSELMACLGLVGGLLTPSILAVGAASVTLVLLTVLVGAVVLATVTRGWRVLPWLGMVAGAIAWCTAAWAGAPPPLLGATAAITGATFAVGRLRAGAALSSLGLLVLVPTAPEVGLLGVAGIAGLLGRRGHPAVAAVVGGLTMVAATLPVVRGSHAPDLLWLVAMTGPFLAQCLHQDDGRDSMRRTQLVLLGLVAVGSAAVGVVSGSREDLLPWIAFGCAAASWAASVDVRDRRLAPESAVLVPLGMLGASALLMVGTGSPWLRGPLGLALVAGSLLGPLLPSARPDSRWAPVAALPFAAGATFLAWSDLVGAGFAGLPCLAIAGFALAALRAARGVDRTIYLVVALGFAALAVPAQLEREWWTIGWALMAAGLARVGRDRPALRWGALVLAAAVVARLVLNPAVLDYHLVRHPTLWTWVLYGYGVPALALAHVARDVTEPAWARRAVQWALAATLFAGLNLQLSHALVQGGELVLFDGHLLRTVGWGVLAVGLLVAGRGRFRPLREAGVVVLGLVVLKVLAADLWALHGLARAGLLLAVSGCFLAAAGLLHRAAPARVST